MKAPVDMQVYHKSVEAGQTIELRNEPWTAPEHRESYLGFLDGALVSTMNVLEFGAGGSTAYIAQRVKYVMSYELDPVWRAVVRQDIEARGITNAGLKTGRPYEDCTADMFAEYKPLHAIFSDIWHGPGRPHLVKVAMELLEPNGLLVYHNHIKCDALWEAGWHLVRRWGDWKMAWRKP